MPSNLENALTAFGGTANVVETPNDLDPNVLYVPGTVDTSGTVTKVSSGNISWWLTGVASSGTFNNGDPWVVPSGASVVITRISPAAYVSTGPDPRHAHGSMQDPHVLQMSPGSNYPGSAQGYDNGMYATYAKRGENGVNLDYNAALNIGLQLPYTVTPDSSIVSTQSHGVSGNRPQLRRAAVLTVLSSAPAAGSFRPSYVNPITGGKTIYSNSGIDYSALQVLTPLSGAPSFETAADWFARCRLNHTPQWFQRYLHPETNMPDYGQDIAAQVSTAALMLLDNSVSDATKKPLLENFLQLGIDLYGVAKAVEIAATSEGATDAQARANYALHPFHSNGGHINGNKWVILFTGMVLGVQDMIDITNDDSAVAFSEDDSTFYVSQTEVDGDGGYVSGDIGTAEWGDRYSTEPDRCLKQWVALTDDEVDNANPPLTATEKRDNQSLKYRRCCTANAWYGFVLAAAAMPNGKTNWGHNELFDYMTRYRSTELALGFGITPELRWKAYGGAWTYSMWAQHAATYGL